MAVYDINRIAVPDAPPEYEDHTRDVHYVPAPCQVACPVGTDAPSYIAHIWDEDYEAAFEAITSTNPFSSICGRVCDAPCEPACRRVDSDGAVQIRSLKRFVMDKLGATWPPPAAPVTRSPSIGIVGAGPAGLVAAHDLIGAWCVRGVKWRILEADQCIYLHPGRARLPLDGPEMVIGEHDYPDVVLEVDHTTDVRWGKLRLYEEWGLPEVWVKMPEAGNAVKCTAADLSPGLTTRRHSGSSCASVRTARRSAGGPGVAMSLVKLGRGG